MRLLILAIMGLQRLSNCAVIEGTFIYTLFLAPQTDETSPRDTADFVVFMVVSNPRQFHVVCSCNPNHCQVKPTVLFSLPLR